MTWAFDSIAFLAWIILGSQLMIREVEDTNLENWGEPKRRRQQGFRRLVSGLGLLPILWFLFVTHGLPFVVLFLFLANVFAFQMRFFTYKIPTWILTIIAIVSFLPAVYVHWWT